MSKNLIAKLQAALDSGELFEIADSSLSYVQVLRSIGFSNKGQYVGIVRDFLHSNDVDTQHFTATGKPRPQIITKTCLCCGVQFNTEPRNTKEQVTCSRACSNTYFRSGTNNGNFIDGSKQYRDKAFKIYKPLCNRCGFDNILALEVHHKDRDRSNNDLSNLEIVCANCHTIDHKSV